MRDYYVSLVRGPRIALLAGPFDTEEQARNTVDAAVKLANEYDQWSWFDSFGTCSLPRFPWNPKGKLNSKIGLDVG